MPYVVSGATGTVGSRVVEQLIARGERPRVFVRDGKKARALFGDLVDIVIGDLADASTLKPALLGADGLFLVNSGPSLAAHDAAAARAARDSSVKHLVKLSSYDAQENVGTGVWHAQGESAIRDSGIRFTFVQPSGFMSNALEWARTIKDEGVVRSCTGKGKIPFIHPQDIADVATTALTSHQYDGTSLRITGPQALSYAEMTACIGAAMGKKLTFEAISEDQVRQEMLAWGDPEDIVAAHLSIYQAIQQGRLAPVTDTVERVLGRKAITFDQWVRENLARFAPGNKPCLLSV